MVTKARLLHDTVIIPSGSVATTQSASDNTTKVATTAYVTTAIANLADSAPSTLNTLNELAAALGDDANFSTTVTNSLATKATIASPSFTGNATFDTDSNSKFLISDGGADAITLYGGSGDELYIGADNAYKLRFRTNGNIVMDNGGKFGIGTDSPGFALDISNTSSVKINLQGGTNQNGIRLAAAGQGGVSSSLYYLGAGSDLMSGGDYGTVLLDVTNNRSILFMDEGNSRLNFNNNAMTITNSGNVGIGTTSPTSALTINGSSGAEVRINNAASGDISSGFRIYNGSNLDTNIYTNPTFGNTTILSREALAIRAGGAERIRVDTSGHVGIGTNSPYDSAWGTNSTQLAVSGSNYGTLHLIGTSLPTRFSIGAGDQKLYLAYDDVQGAHRIVVDSAGKVGIGLTTPDAKLHIFDTNPVIRVSDDGTSGFSTLELRQQNTATEGFEVSYNSGTGHTHLNNVYSGGDMVFATATGSFGTTSTNERMRVKSNGNVGIGDNDPPYKLSVSGTGGTRAMIENTDTNWAALDIRAGGNQANYVFFKDDSAERARMQVFDSNDIAFSTGNSPTERMRIKDNGHVQIGYQPHWFGSITNTSGSGFANSYQARHSRNTINIITSGGYLRWVAPTAGVYLITFTSIADNGTGRIDSTIYINGTSASNQLSSNNGTGYRQRTGVIVVDLSANDQISFHHGDWYNSTSTGFDEWRTAGVAMIS